MNYKELLGLWCLVLMNMVLLLRQIWRSEKWGVVQGTLLSRVKSFVSQSSVYILVKKNPHGMPECS